ncbi:MAG: hypothetical protein R2705_21270 [Ilumatobacteraceae bacterium]
MGSLTGQMLAGHRLGSAAASLAVVPGTDSSWRESISGGRSSATTNPPHLDRV